MAPSDADYDSSVAKFLLALDRSGIGDAVTAEVTAILESQCPAVMGTGG